MKPLLCLFTDSHQPSGVGEHVLTLASELAARFHPVIVAPPIAGGWALLERAADLGLDVLPLNVNGQSREPWVTLRDWLKLRRVAVFHGHAGATWEGHHGCRAAREAGAAVVRTEHLPNVLTKAAERDEHLGVVSAAVDRLVCVSQEVCASHEAAGVDPGKLRVVRNGIRPPRPAAGRGEVRARLGLPGQAPVVLTVARLTEQKGHRHLLEAVPAVLERRPDTHFVWAGEGPLEWELRDRIRAGGLEHRVHLIGRRPDVPDLLGAADLFVLPSLFEGFPLAVLEAMAAGLPVVGTAVCGTSEAVLDGLTGHLVPPGDGPGLARAVLETLAAPGLGRRFGAAGRARVERDFGAARMARETAVVYDEVLHSREPLSLALSRRGVKS